MSNISNQHDGKLDIETNKTPNVSMLITPIISCWEAGWWELYTKRQKGMKNGSSTIRT